MANLVAHVKSISSAYSIHTKSRGSIYDLSNFNFIFGLICFKSDFFFSAMKMAVHYSNHIRHFLHCIFYLGVILMFELSGTFHRDSNHVYPNVDPLIEYGYVVTVILYILRFLSLLALPQALFNFFGLTVYSAFPDKVTLKSSPMFAPFICIRTVTRGDYPHLVINNVRRNINLCLDVGLENFSLQVVTDKPINLPKQPRIQEIVVPKSYKSKSGAMFKARALQYCLEDNVNTLQENDWIVHLDEETLLTENSVRGILNFVSDGRCQFGQGMITYANEQVENWATTLADSFRVAEDLGKIRFQFHAFHRPLFGWKGSYVVSQVAAERKVSYDHGPDGSVAEDCFFSMVAYREGYLFDFIEGEMWEKSPFTFWDFLQQRKRWMQGIYLVVHNSTIPFTNKFFLMISLYSWIVLPLLVLNGILSEFFLLPGVPVLNSLCTFISGVTIYNYIFGAMKSFNMSRLGPLKYFMLILGSVCAIPLNGVIENVAVIWGLFGEKYHFYVVNKEIKSTVTV